ncbi:hypothetical protein GDO81_007985 [Engystomops pustulosus]|uniref:Uncharacterized protein n=1 Tax=Engystomops pustulosus TaxID=76066 RepID=A0AAV7CC80_ENGPU|nr:hypothetical protein GDO81_007985 [Engystomops pustulosus]
MTWPFCNFLAHFLTIYNGYINKYKDTVALCNNMQLKRFGPWYMLTLFCHIGVPLHIVISQGSSTYRINTSDISIPCINDKMQLWLSE